MPTRKPYRTERARLKAEMRRQRRAERFPRNAVCLRCLEPDLDALRYPSDSILEAHHPLGRSHARKVIAPLCHNCHRKEHARLAEEGVDLTAQPTELERIREAIHALALFLRTLADWLLTHAVSALDQIISLLDNHLPTWREIWRVMCPKNS
jgi:hypothetical protein